MATVSLPRRPASPVPRESKPRVDGRCLFLHIPSKAYTLAGFRAWTDSDEFPEKGVRATFINGEIYLDMSMEDLETHAAVKAETSWVLRGLDREEERGKF